MSDSYIENEEDIILADLSDDELVEQMHDDLYDGLKEEIEEGTNILLSRGWSAEKGSLDHLRRGEGGEACRADGAVLFPEGADYASSDAPVLRPEGREEGVSPEADHPSQPRGFRYPQRPRPHGIPRAPGW